MFGCSSNHRGLLHKRRIIKKDCDVTFLCKPVPASMGELRRPARQTAAAECGQSAGGTGPIECHTQPANSTS